MPDDTKSPEAEAIRPQTSAEEQDVRSAFDIDVIEDVELGQFEAVLNGYEVGKLAYRRVGHRLVLLGLVVISSFRGNGIGMELTARALARVHETGRTITVLSPEVRSFLNAHPGYEHLVDPEHPGLPKDTSASL